MSIRKTLASIAAAGLITASLLAGSALGASAVPTGIGGQHQTTFTPGRYIVTLVDPSVATYRGGINGFAPTKPDNGKQLNARGRAQQSYGDYLAGKQKDVAAKAGVTVDQSYTLALNGFSATLTAKQAAALSADKAVASLAPDELKHVAATPSTSFLGLDGANGVWAKTGGVDHAGEGIVLGDLDTGIAPENPSFAGDPLGTIAGAAPYLDGTTTTYAKADGSTFRGVCTTGEQFTAGDCSTKIISARYYLDGFGAGNIGNASTGEYVSPRDGDGHGSHTASTAAGNARVPAAIDGVSYGTITGVAPAAKIAVYKVCWSGPDPKSTTDDGCATSDLLAAIDQAVADGVDVINYSIGGGPAQTTVSPTTRPSSGRLPLASSSRHPPAMPDRPPRPSTMRRRGSRRSPRARSRAMRPPSRSETAAGSPAPLRRSTTPPVPRRSAGHSSPPRASRSLARRRPTSALPAHSIPRSRRARSSSASAVSTTG
ncbi:MAG: serine protease [Microbacteriaceae bacterium]|nr:serine protease [Microbacteriaceae bacterium]